MSINSLANAAAARRPTVSPRGRPPRTLDEIAEAASTPPTRARVPPAGTVPPDGAEAGKVETEVETGGTKDNVQTALNVLFGYIPTEVVTLYVAVLAAIGVEGKVTEGEWASYWIFLLATPVVVWLVYGAKLKNADHPLPLTFGSWPLWEMSAATIAFAAWAFALPESPFAALPHYSSALAGVVVLITSGALGLVAPFFQNELKP